MILAIFDTVIVGILVPCIYWRRNFDGKFYHRVDKRESNKHWDCRIWCHVANKIDDAVCTSTLDSHMNHLSKIYPGCIFQYVA